MTVRTQIWRATAACSLAQLIAIPAPPTALEGVPKRRARLASR